MAYKQHILIIGFCLFICFPILNSLIPILPDIASNENRRISSFPRLDTCAPENISLSVEKYLIENTSIRNRMIKLYNQLNIFVFKSSPVSIKAIVGKQGWFFMSGEEIKTFNGTSLFTPDQLVTIKNELLRRKKIIEQNNGKFIFGIIPNKSNVYPEYMPEHIVRSNKGYGKQLLNFLKESNFPVIDFYTPLIKAKKYHDVYFHTDNHWNDFGAFIATNEILKEIKKTNLSVNELDTLEYPVKIKKDKPGNIANMFSIENQITEWNYVPHRKEGFKTIEKKQNKYKPIDGFPYPKEYEITRFSSNDSLPTILVIRDSFGKNLIPYLSEQSKKCVAIYDGWHYALNNNIIKEEKPQIVLLLVIESNLKNIMKYKDDN